MDFKVIYSSGGSFNKNPDQKLADSETIDGAKLVVDALVQNGHAAKIYRVTPAKINYVKRLKADAVFNLCEWSGRDYPLGVNVLKALESKKIPFTGADSKSYEWCCNKIEMKRMFDKFYIPTPAWIAINPDSDQKTISEKINKLKFPIIAKPAYEHCAIGINKKSVIHTKSGAAKIIFNLLKIYKEPVLVEEFVKGREFTITLLKNHRLHIFPPAEIIFKNKGVENFLSFESQWTAKIDQYGSEVLEDKELAAALKKTAKKIFFKMSCKGYVRIDIRYRAKKIYVLEVNINPGLAPYESYGLTVSTEAAGWSFNKLVNEIALAAVDN